MKSRPSKEEEPFGKSEPVNPDWQNGYRAGLKRGEEIGRERLQKELQDLLTV